MLKTTLPQDPDGTVRILQLTDTHLFAEANGELLGVPTAASLAAVLAEIERNETLYELVLATGDISQDHSAASYQRFAAMVGGLGKPIYWLPGNHDDGPLMNQCLQLAGVNDAKLLVGDHWSIILLDTQVVGKPHGELSGQQLELLDKALSDYPDRHVLIALHHQAVPMGCAWLDQHNLKNADALFALLACHPQQKTILFGHVHQGFDEVHHGVRLIATPSTCVQFKPRSTTFALDDRTPGWRYLTLSPDGRIATHVCHLAAGQFLPNPDAVGY